MSEPEEQARALLNIKPLLYFTAVVEQGSFTKAAKSRGMTQPALSFHVTQLEEELGVKLFDRTPRGVTVSVYGRELYERVLPLIRDLSALPENLAELAHPEPTGWVRCGLPPSLCTAILPKVTKTFSQKYPGVSVEVREGFSAALQQDLLENSLDFVIGAWSGDRSSLYPEFVFEEELILASGQPICGPSGTSCRLNEIADLHLCLVPEVHPLGAMIAQHIRHGRITPCRTVTVGGFASSRQFIHGTGWASITSRSAIQTFYPEDQIFTYPIEYPSMKYEVYGLTNRKHPLSRPAILLFEAIHKEFARLDFGKLLPCRN